MLRQKAAKETKKLRGHAGSTKETVQGSIMINITHYHHWIFLLGYE